MKLATRAITVTVVASLLLGCATRPTGTPGSGFGSEYTPIVDMSGVDPARWSSDLAACREYARQVDTAGNAATGALAGALLGAALMAAAGGNRRWTERQARVGAVEGTAAGLAGGVQKERVVMNNCIIGRGYRVLDSNIAFVPQQMQPQIAAAPAPLLQLDGPAAVGQPVPLLAVYRPAQQPVPEMATAVKDGKWIRESERAATFVGCMVPVARLTLAEPGFERYAVRCGGDGGEEALKINCEKGRCSSQR